MNILAVQANAVEEFYSRDGYRVSFVDKRWKLSKDIVIPISALAGTLSAEMHLLFRHVLAFFAKTGSPAHAANIFYSGKHYLESTVGQPPFSLESLISFRSMLNNKTEYRLGTLRGLSGNGLTSGIPASLVRP